MTQNITLKETHFYIIGISYKKADADMRGLFSLDIEHQERILIQAQEEGMEGLAILSFPTDSKIMYSFKSYA